MNLRYLAILFSFIVLVAQAQILPPFHFRLKMKASNGQTDAAYFFLDSNATRGFDANLETRKLQTGFLSMGLRVDTGLYGTMAMPLPAPARDSVWIQFVTQAPPRDTLTSMTFVTGDMGLFTLDIAIKDYLSDTLLPITVDTLQTIRPLNRAQANLNNRFAIHWGLFIPTPPDTADTTDTTTALRPQILVPNKPFAFPNPAKDYINLVRLLNGDAALAKVFMYNSQGQLVESFPYSLDTPIYIGAHPAGLYHLRLWYRDKPAAVQSLILGD